MLTLAVLFTILGNIETLLSLVERVRGYIKKQISGTSETLKFPAILKKLADLTHVVESVMGSALFKKTYSIKHR